MQPIPESELIFNADGSIYHLNLHPEQLADTVLTVGDPGRVARISKYFDKIETRSEKREFVTHTGWLGQQRLTVLSTGIGTENIDIVMNELDALVNIDFKTRLPKTEHKALTIIRVGTSGAVWADAPVDALVASAFGIGLGNLMHFYEFAYSETEREILDALSRFAPFPTAIQPQVFAGDAGLLEALQLDLQGITLTAPGFYAPQGRQLRAVTKFSSENLHRLNNFQYKNWHITNFEMETAAIFGLAKILGHRAASCNVLIANRISKQFSSDPAAAVEKLIRAVLEKVTSL